MTDHSAERTYVIAEAGVNHNGSLDMALELVDVAATAGADAIKFQTFKADRIATPTAHKARYQLDTTDRAESQIEMLRRLEMSPEMHDALIARCAERGIAFLSTPFDLESLDYLVGELGMRTVKIPSGELTNGPFLLRIARRAETMILSTGMSTLGEVEMALKVLAWGLEHPERDPAGLSELTAYRPTAEVEARLRERVTVLHCTTEYPAAYGDTNLRAMDTLASAFGVKVGFSDHTAGIACPIAAVARGAVVVEKHFTLDRALPGPDHRASLEPGELTEMIAGIRAVEMALGDGRKRVTAPEVANREMARKSLVFQVDLKAGETITEAALTVKRPGTGRSPMEYWDVLGRTVTRDVGAEEPVPESL